MAELIANIGEWYQMPDGQLFEVVAMEGECIEIQYFGGEVEELEQESWGQMFLSKAEAPEDWSGAYDKIESDDLGYSDMVMRRDNWSNPLDVFEFEEEVY